MAESVPFVESEAIEKRELSVHAVAKHDVAELVCQKGGEAGLIRKHIEQTATQDDGVAHGIGLKGGGHEHTAADLRLDVETVGQHKIVDHHLEDFVDLAIRGHQTLPLEARDDIIFRLASPEALCL